jgi:hypothetical protein
MNSLEAEERERIVSRTIACHPSEAIRRMLVIRPKQSVVCCVERSIGSCPFLVGGAFHVVDVPCLGTWHRFVKVDRVADSELAARRCRITVTAEFLLFVLHFYRDGK